MTTQLAETKSSDSLEWVDLADVKIDPACSRLLTASGARRFRALALCRVAGELVVGTCNARGKTVHDFVAQRMQEPFRLVRVDEAGGSAPVLPTAIR